MCQGFLANMYIIGTKLEMIDPITKDWKSSFSPLILSITYATGICPKERVNKNIVAAIPTTSTLPPSILSVKKTAKIGAINPNPERIKKSEIVKVLTTSLTFNEKTVRQFR